MTRICNQNAKLEPRFDPKVSRMQDLVFQRNFLAMKMEVLAFPRPLKEVAKTDRSPPEQEIG